MSHDLAIDTASGEAEMMYVGTEKPWHGLGQQLDQPATSAEAIIAAHMNWKIKKIPMQLVEYGNPVPRKAAMARMNDDESVHTVFGVVGDGYTPLDNTEAFDFFDSIVGNKQAVYDTCGCLDGGRRIWLLAKLPNDIIIKGKDVVEKYTLLSTTHDGSGAIQLMNCPNRVVCRNTLNVALSESTEKISIRHTKNAKAKVELARETLGIAIQHYRKFEDVANVFASISLNTKVFTEYLDKVFPLKPTDTKVTIDHINEIKDEVSLLFDKGKGNEIPEIKHSLWCALNGIVEYADFKRTVRKESPENRLNSIWFGSSMQLKNEAFQAALEIAK